MDVGPSSLVQPLSRLLIKYPTRARPDRFRESITRYRDLLSGQHDVQFVVTCDVTDWRMNRPSMRRWLREFGTTTSLHVHYGWSRSKIEAVNADLADYTADVLLLASDDMVPQLAGYDDLMVSTLAEHFPNLNGAVKFNDGLRDDGLMTYPVMGWSLYRAFGYIYHPAYRSLFCDNEQTESCRALSLLADSPECVLKHEWRTTVDRLHRRNENKRTARRDQQLFECRRSEGFDLERVRATLSRT